MKNLILSTLGIAIGLSAWGWNLTHKSPRIGYAETSILLSEFSEAIQARKHFEAAQKEWDANLKTLNDSLVAGMETMKVSYDKAPAAKKDSMRAGLQRRNDDLQRYSNAVKKMSQEKEKELMDPVIKKMNSFLDLWGKQHGYDMLFGTMTGGNILQADAGFNLTASVLKDLNEHYRDLPEARDSSTTKAADSSAKVAGK